MPRAVAVLGLAALLTAALGSSACEGDGGAGTGADANAATRPRLLSEWGLFADGARQRPAAGVVPYELNTPLFSDYTEKHRFVRLPEGATVEYDAEAVLAFPVGTVLVKTFAYPVDARDPATGERLLETRLLVHRADGWEALPYVWNEAQTDARLAIAGATLPTAWIDADGGSRSNEYLVPNVNQCKECHAPSGQGLEPVGPTIRNLNRVVGTDGEAEPQLERWRRLGVLRDGPAPEDAPRLAAWDDPASGDLDARARAWLEVNCAHCHNAAGPAATSGLSLTAAETSATALGVHKAPVAAGPGTGGRRAVIVPGAPEDSILVYRVATAEPGVLMPEIGNRMAHAEGAELMRQWIAAMDE